MAPLPSPRLIVPARRVLLFGLEVMTSLGIDSRTVRAEASSGTLPFAETEVDDTAGAPARAARCPLLSSQASRTDRMAALARGAFAAHLAAVQPLLTKTGRILVLLALPKVEPANPYDPSIVKNALNDALDEMKVHVDLRISEESFQDAGRSGFYFAMARAAEFVDAAIESQVVVGAVDSWVDSQSLERLATNHRLLGSANRDGLLPGEAAGFALVTGAQVRLPPGTAAISLLAVSLEAETIPFTSSEPSFSDGLTRAFRAFTKVRAINGRTDHVVSGQSCESFWATEFSRAYLRNAPLMPEPLVTSLVAAKVGDVGTASGILGLLLAQEAVSDRGGKVIAYACADDGAVAACIIECPPESASTSLSARAASFPAFQHSKSLNHLDEAGFLIRQRRSYFQDTELMWTDSERLEQRALRHLRALLVWDARASALWETALEDLDPDLFTGACWLLASSEGALTQTGLLRRALLASLDGNDAQVAQRLTAWTDAFRHSISPHLGDVLTGLLTEVPARLQMLLLDVLGRRKDGRDQSLLAIFRATSTDHAVREAAALALSRRRSINALPEIEDALRTFPQSWTLIQSALWLGSPLAVECAMRTLKDQKPTPQMLRTTALTGSMSAGTWLADFHPVEVELQVALATALGLLGFPNALPKLLAYLKNADVRVSKEALIGLRALTGTGSHGIGSQAVPFTVADWESWCRTQGSALSPKQRYRHGKPFHWRACVQALRQPASDSTSRALALAELRVHSPQTVGFEIDDFVSKQRVALAAFP